MNNLFQIPLSAPDLTNCPISPVYPDAPTAILTVLQQETDAFEQAICTATQTPYGCLAASGSDALALALAALGITTNDEVLCQSLTFVATANAISRLRGRPIFVDSEADTWNICPDTLEMAIRDRIRLGKRPKAVIAVDLYGMPANWRAIEVVCDRYGIALIEDAAEALGSRYQERACGSFGRMAIFSFNRNKIITTLGGGAVVSASRELIDRVYFLNTQAREAAPYYLHHEQGFNHQWAQQNSHLGRKQLQHLPNRVARRRATFQFYRQALGQLPGIAFQPEPNGAFSNRWLTALTLDTKQGSPPREQVRLALKQAGIESRPVFYPMHRQPLYKKSPFYRTGLADKLFADGLCLPSGSTLTTEQRQRVVDVIKSNY